MPPFIANFFSMSFKKSAILLSVIEPPTKKNRIVTVNPFDSGFLATIIKAGIALSNVTWHFKLFIGFRSIKNMCNHYN